MIKYYSPMAWNLRLNLLLLLYSKLYIQLSNNIISEKIKSDSNKQLKKNLNTYKLTNNNHLTTTSLHILIPTQTSSTLKKLPPLFSSNYTTLHQHPLHPIQ